jgi:hypothetical protein
MDGNGMYRWCEILVAPEEFIVVSIAGWHCG